MTVPEILKAAKAAGGKLYVRGDKLVCRFPKGALTPELREEFRRKKAEILRLARAAKKARPKEPSPGEKPEELETPVHRAVEKLSGAAREAALASPSRHIPHPLAKKGDRTSVPKLDRASADAFARAVKEPAAPYVGGIAARIVNLLRAPAPVWLSDREAGRIDSRALPGVRAGLKTAFSETVKLPDLDAAVVLLLDASGSMRWGGKVDVARQAAFVMGEVLHRVRVPFEILSWYEDDGVDPGSLPEEDRELYTRFESRLFTRYKAFEERNWPHVAPRLMAYRAGGNNDDGGAVRDAARRLAARPEKLKVLLSLSDGLPEHYGAVGKEDGWERLHGHLRDAVRDAERAGLRVGGFGICTDHVRSFYPHWAAVNRIEDMPGSATRLLGRLLRRTA